jgi:hypothetical protein
VAIGLSGLCGTLRALVVVVAMGNNSPMGRQTPLSFGGVGVAAFWVVFVGRNDILQPVTVTLNYC